MRDGDHGLLPVHMMIAVLWCFGALHFTHIASSSHLTWNLIFLERFEIICV